MIPLKRRSTVEFNEQNVKSDDYFSYCPNFISSDECREIMDSVGELSTKNNGEVELQNDVPRSKKIAYVINFKQENGENTYDILSQSHLKQNVTYNDFNGGYNRYYERIPESYLETSGMKKILDKHYATFKLPNKTVTLCSIQKSVFTNAVIDKQITGQGLHTDGNKYASIINVELENMIQTPVNEFWSILERTEEHGITKDTVTLHKRVNMKVGDFISFRDDQMYHSINDEPEKYIEQIKIKDDVTGLVQFKPKLSLRRKSVILKHLTESAKRTVIVLLSPGEVLMFGKVGNDLLKVPNIVIK